MKLSRFTLRNLLSLALVCVAASSALADEDEDAEVQRIVENKIPADVETALDEAAVVVLQSISPKRKPNFNGPAGPEDYPLLGEVKLSKDDRRRVVAAFRAAVADRAEANKKGVGGAGCFIPRHALRLTHQGTEYCLLICFECSNVRIYKDDVDVDGLGILDSDGKHSKVLDRVLTAAKIELAPLK